MGTFSSSCAAAFATIASLASNPAQISAHALDAAADLLDARCIRDAHEAVAALSEGDAGDDEDRGGGERLRKGGRARGDVLMRGDDRRQQLGRAEDPAEAEPGHAVRLRHAADDEDVRAAAEHRRWRRFVPNLAIDLVGDDEDARLRDRVQRLFIDDRAERIRRRVDDDELRLLRDLQRIELPGWWLDRVCLDGGAVS